MKAFLTIILLLTFGASVWGNTPTPEEIAEWKERAENGDPEAQNKLGLAYGTGSGVLENDKEAVKWYRKAAAQGNADAQFDLGNVYSYGEGVPEDKKEGAKWWRKAAEQGLAAAQFGPGLCYDFWEGVIEDKVQAYAWLNIAVANGNEGAKEAKTNTAEFMTKEQIAKAQDLSREMIEANPKLMGD